MDPAVAAVTFIVIQDRHTRHKLDLLLSFHHKCSRIKKASKHPEGVLRPGVVEAV
jgi:hypothetical protein